MIAQAKLEPIKNSVFLHYSMYHIYESSVNQKQAKGKNFQLVLEDIS